MLYYVQERVGENDWTLYAEEVSARDAMLSLSILVLMGGVGRVVRG